MSISTKDNFSYSPSGVRGVLRIGTRESQLAVWQAELVKSQLAQNNIKAELVFIKSEGDIDLVTPLYEIGVQGISLPFLANASASLASGVART